jgi:hypothetical protein
MEVEELFEGDTGLRPHTVFAHVLMKNAKLYRAILQAFVQSRVRGSEIGSGWWRDER